MKAYQHAKQLLTIAASKKPPGSTIGRWRKILLTASLLLLSLESGFFTTAQTQTKMETSSKLMADLDDLESKSGLNNSPELPVTTRLIRLEQRILGSPSTGGIVPRLELLKQATQTATSNNAVFCPPGAVQSGEAFPLLNAFPPKLVRMEKPGSPFQSKRDYFDEVKKSSKGKCIHFKTMPIPIYVQPYPDREFMNCVLRACENWELKTDGIVRFVQADNALQARIRIAWKHLGAKADSSGCLLGAHTILNYKDRGNGSLSLMSVGTIPVPIYLPRLGPKYQVPPQVMEVNLDLIMQKEPSIRSCCLQNIVTHELGHALGLLGHSPSSADMMHPITDEHSRLSERDVNTLKRLYESKVDIPL